MLCYVANDVLLHLVMVWAPRCYSATINGTVLKFYSVTVLQCNNVTDNVAVLQCYSARWANFVKFQS